ncbi:MAG: acyl carrier protein [Caulobacteraceae bacterium]
MDRDAVRLKIQELLRDILDDDEIVLTDDMTASDVVDWDSTNHVRLIVALEEDLGIRFETEEITAPESVGQLVELLASKLG